MLVSYYGIPFLVIEIRNFGCFLRYEVLRYVPEPRRVHACIEHLRLILL